MSENEWNVIIGKVGATHGLKGDVRVWPATDYPGYLEELHEFMISGKTFGPRILKVSKARVQKNAVIMRFDGISNISEAEMLRDAEVRIRESDIRPLGEGEYFIEDIIGLEVWTTEDECLGRITEVLQTPANDVYVTDTAMIPAVKEFVVEIDLENRKMVVRHVEGLVQS